MSPAKRSIRRHAASRSRSPQAPQAPRATKSSKTPVGPIRHLVVLMLENRSFDHILGCLTSVYPQMVGIDSAHPRSNLDDTGSAHFQRAGAGATVNPGPAHDHDDVVAQIAHGNSGFVRNYQHSAKAPQGGLGAVMAYHGLGTLPAIHALARDFTVCDHWFSSVPGPTWTNRFFAHSGTSQGRVEMPHLPFHWNLHDYDQDTIYDRLNQKGVSWRIYHDGFPQSLLLAHQRRWKNAARYDPMTRFYKDAKGAEKAFPSFSFIEPDYFPPGANDDHPPHDIRRGQKLIADVYAALRANAALWASTLLVVVYDEHGGFYDQVTPGKAVPPDSHHEEYGFDQYGVRVPALLISPWVGRGVAPSVFDHTSVLRYATELWGLKPLGARVAAANSLGVAIKLDGPRKDTPATVPSEPLPKPSRDLARKPPKLNDHQRALIGFSDYLETLIDAPPKARGMRYARTLRSPIDSVEVAKTRVELFLRQQRKRARR
ncbi:MAG TPA: alkaline phosphatase family protein [Patescibacteria group bacterium]|nr:alkaline phosphatase family protein [Patescibacteria group bacterium]